MQGGAIREKESGRVIGQWRADEHAIAVETDEPNLKRAAAEILERAQTIPIHGPEHHEFVGEAEPLVERPSTIKFLALFALEMEGRGYVVEPGEEE